MHIATTAATTTTSDITIIDVIDTYFSISAKFIKKIVQYVL